MNEKQYKNNKNHNNRNKNNTNGYKDSVREVILPYDFVPFVKKDKCEYPYTIKRDLPDKNTSSKEKPLPKHNSMDKENLSGVLSYKITPQSDLAIEVREKMDGKKFISGSIIRGKIRSNMEILGACYPEFIDKSPLLYRDITDSKYKNRLMGEIESTDVTKKKGDNKKKDVDIESLIKVGFLQKIGNEYYVTPAKKRENKNFLSIKEHRLRQMGVGTSGKEFSYIYEWNENLYKYEDDKSMFYNDKNKREKRKKSKRELDQLYKGLKQNNMFKPYQKEIRFRSDGRYKIEEITFNLKNDTFEKGFLYNSTNASSKRSHYIILEPMEDKKDQYHVPQDVINGYELYLKKLRLPNNCDKNSKQFYDIFGGYTSLANTCKEGLIVFYKLNKEKKEIKNIGRTPYFKIEYKNQLEDIINSQVGEYDKEKVDYVNALFGFIWNENEKGKTNLSYKSRLRFTPTDIIEKNTINEDRVDNFLLMTPYASACGMYLDQTNSVNNKVITYEDDKDKIKLNGYKYYHVLEKENKPNSKEDMESMLSSKKVLKPNGFIMKGKIYFNNLTRKELGLLLLSVDWTLLRNSKNYKAKVKDYDMEKAYELIGGAKPYGYGKVNIQVEEVEIEKKANDFESLVIQPMKKVEQWDSYIDEFIKSMDKNYFDNIQFYRYAQSKMEKSFIYSKSSGGDLILNWNNAGKIIKEENDNEGGGYPKEWCLKRERDMKSELEKLQSSIRNSML